MGSGKIKKSLGKIVRFFVELTIMGLTSLAVLLVISVTWATTGG